jgi:hypothetical protein
MTSISAASFEDAWKSPVSATLDGVKVDFIGREALIRNKRAAGRSKDHVEVDELTKGYGN